MDEIRSLFNVERRHLDLVPDERLERGRCYVDEFGLRRDGGGWRLGLLAQGEDTALQFLAGGLGALAHGCQVGFYPGFEILDRF